MGNTNLNRLRSLTVSMIVATLVTPPLLAEETLVLRAVSQPEGNLLRSISLETKDQDVTGVVIRVSGQPDLRFSKDQLMAGENLVARVSGMDAFYIAASWQGKDGPRIKLRYLASFPSTWESFDLLLQQNKSGAFMLVDPVLGEEVNWLYLRAKKVLGLVIGIEAHELSREKPIYKE